MDNALRATWRPCNGVRSAKSQPAPSSTALSSKAFRLFDEIQDEAVTTSLPYRRRSISKAKISPANPISSSTAGLPLRGLGCFGAIWLHAIARPCGTERQQVGRLGQVNWVGVGQLLELDAILQEAPQAAAVLFRGVEVQREVVLLRWPAFYDGPERD